MNPYRKFVSAFAHEIEEGKSLPLGRIPPHSKPAPLPNAPKALIFSPHPDDECIIGGLPLRLQRQSGFSVINIAVTLGSKKERQQGRWQELKNACDWLGFGLEKAGADGLEAINPKTRANQPPHWADAVKVIADLLTKHKPLAIFLPHEFDWNSSHIGVHHLVMDALKTLPREFQTTIVETEFWGQMTSPNLMVELSDEDVADLLAALSYHVEEVRRNPYHLRLPAWLIDNVRRGAELVGGQGGAAPDFTFATLYRVRKWANGSIHEVPSGKLVSVRDSPGEALGWTNKK